MRTLLWFKQDLRLDDHPALQAALACERVLPLFIFDPRLLQPSAFGTRRLGAHRARFLLESLTALDGALRQRGSHLLVLPGVAEQLIPKLVKQLDLQQVLTLEEQAPQARSQLAAVRYQLAGLPLQQAPGDNLLKSEQLPCPLEQLPPSFSQFRQLLERRPLRYRPPPPPTKLPPLPEGAATLLQPLPTLSQLGLGEPLGVANSAFPFSGGEAAAQARLRDYLGGSRDVRQYQQTRNGLSGSQYASKLSAWLANGSLSPRRVMVELQRHEAQHGRNDASYGLWLELLWREFFRWSLLRQNSPRFNTKAVQAGEPPPADPRFHHWCQGRTGLPLVDANMRELAATGYLSTLGRQLVACYLTQDLQQDWRHGAAWFEEHLIDYDPASNWGNWVYLAGGGDPSLQRPFNALRQAREYDPEATYISLWLPELRQLPPHLRHTPFLLPPRQLEALNYPRLESIPDSWRPYLPHAA